MRNLKTHYNFQHKTVNSLHPSLLTLFSACSFCFFFFLLSLFLAAAFLRLSFFSLSASSSLNRVLALARAFCSRVFLAYHHTISKVNNNKTIPQTTIG